MAFSILHHTYSTNLSDINAPDTVTFSLGFSTTANSTLVVFIPQFGHSSNVAAVNYISGSTPYAMTHMAATPQTGGVNAGCIDGWYATNVPAGVGVIKVDMAGDGYYAFTAIEIGGVAPSNEDQFNSVSTATSGSGDSHTGSVTPAQDDAIIVSCLVNLAHTTTAVSPNTLLDTASFNSNTVVFATGYYVQTTAAAFNPAYSTAGGNVIYCGVTISFNRPVVSGTATPSGVSMVSAVNPTLGEPVAKPSGVSMTSTVNSPSGVGVGTGTATGVSMASAVNPALGNPSALPSGVSMTSAVNAPTGVGNGIATPAGVSMRANVGQPTTPGIGFSPRWVSI